MTAKLADRIATAVLWLAAILIVCILGWFVLHILVNGLPVMTWKFLTTRPQSIRAGGGVGPPLFNSFYVLVLSLVFSLPIGMGAGIYMAEYAKPGRFTDAIRLATEALATVPSIVLGLFGMIILVNTFHMGFTIVGGSLTLALLNLPMLVRVTEESVRSVPDSYREGALALGATSYQTLIRTVLPAALPGLVTGLTLVAGRALGETAILIFTAGVGASRHMFDFNLLGQGGTLAVHLWATQANPIVPDADNIANGSAAVLLLMVLVFNLLVSLPAKLWYRKRAGGTM